MVGVPSVPKPKTMGAPAGPPAGIPPMPSPDIALNMEPSTCKESRLQSPVGAERHARQMKHYRLHVGLAWDQRKLRKRYVHSTLQDPLHRIRALPKQMLVDQNVTIVSGDRCARNKISPDSSFDWTFPLHPYQGPVGHYLRITPGGIANSAHRCLCVWFPCFQYQNLHLTSILDQISTEDTLKLSCGASHRDNGHVVESLRIQLGLKKFLMNTRSRSHQTLVQLKLHVVAAAPSQ